MRITGIFEKAVPVASTMRNAAFDFSEMTTSVVAVVTDVVRQGKPVIGYAFNSTGRYACGAAMRARFIPRILSAPPDELIDEAGLIDPDKVLRRMMLREKPGGDAERSVPIGTIETAVWDGLAKKVLSGRYGMFSLNAFIMVTRLRWFPAMSGEVGTSRSATSRLYPTR